MQPDGTPQPMLLKDQGLIGDVQAAAPGGRNGSVDWLCRPRFDSRHRSHAGALRREGRRGNRRRSLSPRSPRPVSRKRGPDARRAYCHMPVPPVGRRAASRRRSASAMAIASAASGSDFGRREPMNRSTTTATTTMRNATTNMANRLIPAQRDLSPRRSQWCAHDSRASSEAAATSPPAGCKRLDGCVSGERNGRGPSRRRSPSSWRRRQPDRRASDAAAA